MSDNTLIEKIKADADAAIAQIKDKQAADVAAVASETDTLVSELEATHEVELAKAKEHVALVTTSRAKQAANIALQQAKRDEIDSICTAALAGITGGSSDDYVKFFTAKATSLVPSDVVATVVETATGRIAEAESILKAINITADVKENANISAGMIVHSADGVYDVTLDRIFADKQADLEMIIAQQLK